MVKIQKISEIEPTLDCKPPIKARNRKTEMLWIFFGIHTSNAVCMIEKVEKKKNRAA